MKQLTKLLLPFLAATGFLSAHEGPWTSARPDGHAPISVMGDHMHAKGEWMLSYRYMSMEMEGLLKGSDTIAPASSGYAMMGAMLPKDMSMDMHMFGGMHAISDKWTLMAMVNYLDNEMTMQNGGSMETNGLGDLSFNGLYDLASWDNGRRVHLRVGIGAPTGSIDERKTDGVIQPYGMQLGSGTWDFLPALTFLGQTEVYSYGLQVGGVLRMGDNDRDYSLGHRFDASLWGARALGDSFSISAKFDYLALGEVDGEDKEVTAMLKGMTSGYEATSQGRDLSTFGLGVNYYCRDGAFKGHRLALEWETPLGEDVNGVQLETDSIWTLGWQYAW